MYEDRVCLRCKKVVRHGFPMYRGKYCNACMELVQDSLYMRGLVKLLNIGDGSTMWGGM